MLMNFSGCQVEETKNQSTQRIQRQYPRTLNNGLALTSVKAKLPTSYSEIITDKDIMQVVTFS
jgi:hypothetical protein